MVLVLVLVVMMMMMMMMMMIDDDPFLAISLVPGKFTGHTTLES